MTTDLTPIFNKLKETYGRSICFYEYSPNEYRSNNLVDLYRFTGQLLKTVYMIISVNESNGDINGDVQLEVTNSSNDKLVNRINSFSYTEPYTGAGKKEWYLISYKE